MEYLPSFIGLQDFLVNVHREYVRGIVSFSPQLLGIL